MDSWSRLWRWGPGRGEGGRVGSTPGVRGARRRAGLWVLGLGATLLLGVPCGVLRSLAADYREFMGCCDASAAAPVNEVLMAVASDEDNVLRLYRRDAAGPPVAAVDVSGFLGLRRREEADLEGAARLGELIFWIGSHSRNKDGKARPGRQVLFATRIQGKGGDATLRPTGEPFRGLVSALATDRGLRGVGFAGAAARAGEAAGGLNIEGLAAGPGGSLWIGFRNPLSGGRALLVPLANPLGVIAGERPRFEALRELDLGGLGIRDLARGPRGYLVVAGPAEGGGRHRLFQWTGEDRAPEEVRRAVPKGFQAEALVVDEAAGGWVDLLGDEDDRKIDGVPCSEVPVPSRRVFRGLRLGF